MALDLSATGGSALELVWRRPRPKRDVGVTKLTPAMGLVSAMPTALGAVLALPAVVPLPWSGFCRSWISRRFYLQFH